MGRPARHIPANTDGVLVEVTTRVTGARALLTPGPDPRRFNDVVVGVMGRALEVSPLELCSTVWLANHAHPIVSGVWHQTSGVARSEVAARTENWPCYSGTKSGSIQV